MEKVSRPSRRLYSDEELLDDIRNVAKELNIASISQKDYDNCNKKRYNSSTIKRRFGWLNAIHKAGLGKSRIYRNSDEDLVQDLQRVAKEIYPKNLTQKHYNLLGKFSSETITNRFGWNKALAKAGLKIGLLRHISLDDLFENLADVWMKIGKHPSATQMVKPLSKYSNKAYMNHFGTWIKAIEAFNEFVNKERIPSEKSLSWKILLEDDYQLIAESQKNTTDINWKFRHIIMVRDNFSCTKCGRSRAKGDVVNLHVAYIKPYSEGGKTVIENLQTLCEECSIKSSCN